MTWKQWLKGLIGGVLAAIGNAGLTWITMAATGQRIAWEQLGMTCGVGALTSVFLWFKEKPLP